MLTSSEVKALALECGFELAGVARAEPLAESRYYHEWVEDGFAGKMTYLTDHRADVRDDPRRLLASAQSIICVGKLYNSPQAYAADRDEGELSAISRYAWGEDYHDVLRAGLERLVERMRERASFEWKICVDTAPLLERAYARHAGLGWIGKNTCLINQEKGSWFFLGELLVSLALEPDAPPPDRCGTCTRCIDACPTTAIVPARQPGGPAFTIDSRLCIAYFTIELRGPIPEEARADIGGHVFGCDICQDVCPWNGRAPLTADPAFAPDRAMPPLEKLAAMSEEEFRVMFRGSPVKRARYTGFLRNVAIAMGNLKREKFREPLERMAESADDVVAEHARWALEQLSSGESKKLPYLNTQ
jgi:epoxyqueuosine reductase